MKEMPRIRAMKPPTWIKKEDGQLEHGTMGSQQQSGVKEKPDEGEDTYDGSKTKSDGNNDGNIEGFSLGYLLGIDDGEDDGSLISTDSAK